MNRKILNKSKDCQCFYITRGRDDIALYHLHFLHDLSKNLQKCWQSILYFLRPKYKTRYLVSAALFFSWICLLSQNQWSEHFQNSPQLGGLVSIQMNHQLAEQDWSQGGNFIKIISSWLIPAAQLCFVTYYQSETFSANFSFVKNRNDFLQQWGQNKANISRM